MTAAPLLAPTSPQTPPQVGNSGGLLYEGNIVGVDDLAQKDHVE